MELKLKELKQIIEKNKKSKFQNCFQCKWFPKENILEKSLTARGIFQIYKSIEPFFWSIQNVEVINFRCGYLRKGLSEAIDIWRTNSCLCFRKSKNDNS